MPSFSSLMMQLTALLFLLSLGSGLPPMRASGNIFPLAQLTKDANASMCTRKKRWGSSVQRKRIVRHSSDFATWVIDEMIQSPTK